MSAPWHEEIDELVTVYPLWVYRRAGQWVCTCLRFDATGRCVHLVPFLRKEDVDVSKEYL